MRERGGAGDRVCCAVARECGGCALIGWPYEEQLREKTERVRQVLARRDVLPAAGVEPCLGAPQPAEYRNRAKLAVARAAGGVRIGLFRRGTNMIVDLAPCRVQRPALQRAIEQLRVWLERHRLARPEGPVFYLDLREVEGGRCHVTLVVSGERLDPDTLPLDDLTRSLPGVAGVAINEGDTESSYPMGPVTRVVRGTETFPAQLPMSRGEPLFLEVPAGGFFQVAPSALPAVHDRMAAHLAGCTVLFDLYCGVGVHGIAVVLRSTCTARVRGIEESVPLVEAARNNAARLGVSARYDPAAVEDRLAESMRESPPDGVILNPGRAGCRRSVVEILNAGPAARIAYLSCNPDTLARDLSGLLRSGFRARAIVPVDLMPQTDHVEVLALLSRDGNAG